MFHTINDTFIVYITRHGSQLNYRGALCMSALLLTIFPLWLILCGNERGDLLRCSNALGVYYPYCASGLRYL